MTVKSDTINSTPKPPEPDDEAADSSCLVVVSPPEVAMTVLFIVAGVGVLVVSTWAVAWAWVVVL